MFTKRNAWGENFVELFEKNFKSHWIFLEINLPHIHRKASFLSILDIESTAQNKYDV